MGASSRVIVVDSGGSLVEQLTDSTQTANEEIEFETARSASAALERLESEAYDGVVSAYELPERDGLSLVAAIRTDRDSEIPIVLVTSQRDETVARKALNLGVDRYFLTGAEASTDYDRIVDALRSEIEEYHARTERRLFEDVVEHVDDPMMFQNLDGEFEVLNQAVTAFADRSEDELLGTDETAFMDEEAATIIQSKKEQVAAEETPLNYEVTPEFPERGKQSFSTLRYPHYDEDGNVDGTVAICRDITELKQTQRELRRERDRLDEFASFVSHDLRNPLNVASGQVELARQECDSERLEKGERELERMDHLITDLLALAREGELVGDVETVQLEEIVTQSWHNVETDDAELTVETAGTIRADPTRTATLFENLFRNAVEHGGPAVTVTVGRLEADNGLFVADDGTGIPREDRESVFESGYSTTDEGTGFGLAIVEQIVEAHGWEITIAESERGGARFEITGVETTTRDGGNAS